jgi:hypothetical protein
MCEQRCNYTNCYPKHYRKVTGWLSASVALPSQLTAQEAGLAPKTGMEVVVEKEISACVRN